MSLILRSATPEDGPTLFQLIHALAAYENLSEAVTGSEQALVQHLFGDRPYAEAALAELQGEAVGYALFFSTYSTFLTKPGLYLEDLFVSPHHRRQGIGKALLRYVAHLALSRGCGRLEWNVLDWNASAIAFYQQMGATVLPDWRTCRVTGEELLALGDAHHPNSGN